MLRPDQGAGAADRHWRLQYQDTRYFDRNRTGELVGGNAHAHAALDDGFEYMAAYNKRG